MDLFEDGPGLHLQSLTLAHWLAVLLATATGSIHLYLYTTEGFLPFLLGGLGYLGGVVLLLFNVRRRLLYVAAIPFVILHVGGWLAAGMPDGGWALAGAPVVTLGTVDKLIELVLLVTIGYLFRKDSPRASYARRNQTDQTRQRGS